VTGASTGSLTVVGLGPGRADWLVPEAAQALAEATDLVGYGPYLDLVPHELVATQERHPSDNRDELDRAGLAFRLACAGRRVVVVSGGDPGVFAMASAVFEAQFAEGAPAEWRSVRARVVPGVTAALATAARIGAPLGHDFCVISLSDNLKPWSIIERRLEAVLVADFVVALYNPVSRQRPTQLGAAFDLIGRHRAPATPVVFGHDVGRPGERLTVSRLDAVDLAACDMRTVVIVGSSTTRWVTGAGPGHRPADVVFTPRHYP
jgi:precorrin-3B C17-methyltransferase